MKTLDILLSLILLTACIASTAMGQDYWRRIQINTSEPLIKSAFDGAGTIYIGGWYGGIYRSVDNGASWTKLTTPMGTDEIVVGLLISPSGTIFAGTTGGKIYRSLDKGINWQLIKSIAGPVRNLAVNHWGYVFAACDGYTMSDKGVFRTTDDGVTWRQMTGTEGQRVLNLEFASDTILYAATYDNGIFRSTDGGESWTHLETNLPSQIIEGIAASKNGCLFAGLEYGLYRSTNGGTTWEQMFGIQSDIRYVKFNSSGVIIVGTYGGVYRSSDLGATWTSLGLNRIQALDVDGEGYLYVSSDSYMYRSLTSSDSLSVTPIVQYPAVIPGESLSRKLELKNHYQYGPMTVTTLATTTSSFSVASPAVPTDIPPGGSITIRISFTPQRGAPTSDSLIIHTSRGSAVVKLEGALDLYGENKWTKIHVDTEEPLIKSSFDNSGATFIGGWYGGIYRSIDNRQNWTKLETGMGTNEIVVGLLTTPSGTLFAATTGGRIYRSRDRGDRWEPVFTINGPVRNLDINPSGYVYAACDGEFYQDRGVFRTTDDGLSWELLAGTEGQRVLNLEMGLLNSVYAVTFDGNILRSINGGDSWTTLRTNLPTDIIEALDITGNGYMFAGLENGLYRSTDEGRVWVRLSGIQQNIRYVKSNTEGVLFVATYGGIFRTSDFGATWDTLGLNRIQALDIDGEGFLYVSSDSCMYRSLRSSCSMLAPALLQFPTALPGDSSIASFNLKNTLESSPITIDTLATTSQSFSVISPSLPKVLSSGDSVTVSLLFTPHHGSAIAGMLSIGTNLGTRYITLQADTLFPECLLRNETVDFGDGTLLSTIRRDVTIVNPSIRKLRIDSLYITTFKFALDPFNFPLYINPNDSMRISVVYAPYGANRCLDTLFILNNSSTAVGKVILYGNYPVPVPDSLHVNFGTTGDTYREIHITNYSIAPLWIDSCRTQSAFFRVANESFPIVISKNTSAALTISFQPVAGIHYADTLTVSTNAFSKELLIPLDGNGLSDSTNAIRTPGSPVNAVPTEYILEQNFPNPFNPAATIRFGVPENCFVTLRVYDSLGKPVATLAEGYQTAGYRTVQWNGRDDLGQSASSGVYFYTLTAGKFVQTRRMIYLK